MVMTLDSCRCLLVSVKIVLISKIIISLMYNILFLFSFFNRQGKVCMGGCLRTQVTFYEVFTQGCNLDIAYLCGKRKKERNNIIKYYKIILIYSKIFILVTLQLL